MKIEIRQIEKVDIEEILAIEKASFTTPWIYSFFKEELDNASSRAYCARPPQGDRLLVGYSVNRAVLDELHILNIASHPDFRRQGIGTQLFKHSIEENPQARIAYLEVREQNKAARAFYHKLGFRVVGRRKRYYSDTGEDAIIMAWTTT